MNVLPTRRVPLASIALLLLLGACASGPAAESTRPPNVVLILVDDLGWMDLGCQGSKVYSTPNIDRLARGGVRFTNGYAACAVCSPTRAAVLTGRYPARIGVTDWIRSRFQRGGIGTPKQTPTEYLAGPRQRLLCPPNPYWMEHAELTIAELLADRGYRTCHIGKWHLGDDDWYPTKQGFHENYGGCDYGQPPSYFDPYKNRRLPGIPNLPPRRAGEYLTDREGDEAIGFIRRNRDRPFFLHLAHYAVHTPIQAKKELVARYASSPVNAKYAAMVESVDAAVGNVIEELESQGLRDDTIILFTSDNGGLLGPTDNTPLRSGKGFPYEGGIRVPFIASWPGRFQGGRVVDEPVCSIDLFPTIAALTGRSPAPVDRVIDGVSLAPILSQSNGGKPTTRERDLLWHFPHYRGQSPYSILRRGRWKLIKRYEGPEYELYDLQADEAETTDRSQDEPEVVAGLASALDDQLRAMGARMPRPNPGFGSPTRSREVHPDNVGKPRVLLIGDSISMGYTASVRKRLHGKAAVFRPMHGPGRAENCQGTNYALRNIDHWLVAEGGEWDVIHFNFGLHDLKRVHPVTRRNSNEPTHPHQSDPVRYERQLRAIVTKLKSTGAKLIYATTTPVPKGVRPYRGVDDPVRYNGIAKRVMAEHQIPINDLFQFASERLAEIQRPRDVHFSKNGSESLAEEVVRHVESLLGGK